MKKKIAIIGAGIAGLTLANLIKKNSDHDFMLYEKQERGCLCHFALKMHQRTF